VADYSNRLAIPDPAHNESAWDDLWRATNAILADAEALGSLCVTLPTAQRPTSTDLTVRVEAGTFLDATGAVVTVAAVAALAVPGGVTSYVYATEDAVVHASASGWPAGNHLRLAVVVAGASTINDIADARLPWSVAGDRSATFLALAGGTMASGAVVHATGGGVQVGGAATEKLGFWGATPIVRPAGANQAALADSTGGTVAGTVADVGASYSQSAINNALASILSRVNAIQAALVAAGIIKGSA
jgi:hypothetical protein